MLAAFRLSRHGDSVLLYPEGAKLLDDGVNEVLEWLNAYPKARMHLENALKFYLNGETTQYRNLLDELRLGLEQLLRAVLKNRRSLENQKPYLNEWLKDKKVHKQLANLFATLLFGPYTLFQNDAVKHGDESNDQDAEFMIYLTATFMRFLLTLDAT